MALTGDHNHEQPPRNGYPVKSADRALDILELLSDSGPGLTLAEIAKALGIARSSAHGLVHTLLARHYIAVDDGRGRRFRLGVRLVQLGLSVVDRIDLRTAARPHIERL